MSGSPTERAFSASIVYVCLYKGELKGKETLETRVRVMVSLEASLDLSDVFCFQFRVQLAHT